MESRAKAGSGSDTVILTHLRASWQVHAARPRASLRTPVGTRLALTPHDLAASGRQHLQAGSA